MLRLKMATEPRWVDLVNNNIKEALIDHAFCEQKAASAAISIIILYPQYSEIVSAMSDLVIEEMDHFRRVHKKILDRGWVLGKERKDDYVNKLRKFFKGGGTYETRLIEKLLFSAMIEARSCERFYHLSRNTNDKDLSEFYHELEQSEAGHFKLFINFARKYGKDIMDVDNKWEEFLKFEADLIQKYNNKEYIHG